MTPNTLNTLSFKSASELRQLLHTRKISSVELTNYFLDRLEKLARRIRSDAGGSEEDVSIESPPQQLEPALSRLAEESDCLKITVEKTPRHVVSAMVIEKANVLLKLIKLARGFLP